MKKNTKRNSQKIGYTKTQLFRLVHQWEKYGQESRRKAMDKTENFWLQKGIMLGFYSAARDLRGYLGVKRCSHSPRWLSDPKKNV